MEIEVDSQLLVHWCLKKYAWPWEFYQVLFSIVALLPRFSTIIHVYREANKAADILAKLASTSQASFSFAQNAMPQELRGCVALDKKGTPSVRLASHRI